MKLEQQRIAIAMFTGKVFEDGKIINYPEDLNAMHKAENLLTEKQVTLFAKNLKNLTKPPFGTPYFRSVWWSNFIRSKSSQRAEAFLKTIRKWRDE